MPGCALIVSDRYPYLHIRVSIRAHVLELWGFVDTGFDGYLVVPVTHAEELGAEDYEARWELADGSLVEASEYVGQVESVGLKTSFPARVTAMGEESLIGRSLIDRFQLTFDRGRRLLLES